MSTILNSDFVTDNPKATVDGDARVIIDSADGSLKAEVINRAGLLSAIPALKDGQTYLATDTGVMYVGSTVNGNIPLGTASKKYKARWEVVPDDQSYILIEYENSIGGTFTLLATSNTEFTLTNSGKFTLGKTIAKANGWSVADESGFYISCKNLGKGQNDADNPSYGDVSNLKFISDYGLQGDPYSVLIEIEVFF